MKNTQRFKNTKLTERKCINSIIRFYELATNEEIKEGLQWYNTANTYCRELAARFNLSIQQAAGLIAVFSPQASWETNKRYVLSFLINPKNTLRSKVQIIKARRIMKLTNEADIFAAQSVNDAAYKTKRFFLNILNPDVVTGVTIDRHAIAVCIQSPDNTFALANDWAQPTKIQYEFFQHCYIKAAASLDVLPHQLQAITWIAYRRIRELKEHSNSNEWKPFTTETLF